MSSLGIVCQEVDPFYIHHSCSLPPSLPPSLFLPSDKYIVGYKDEKDRKKAAKLRGNRPPSWDETVERISQMVLTKEGEQVIEVRCDLPSFPPSLLQSLQKFQCMRCQRLTTLLPGQLEDEVFTPDYKCPQCKSTRDMIVRKS